MKKINLSEKANEVIKKLIGSVDTDKLGYIAAIEPQTAEVFYGKSIVEAAKLGRKMKNDIKAIFFFVINIAIKIIRIVVQLT